MLPPTLVRFVMIAVALLHAAAGGWPHHCHCQDDGHASLTHSSLQHTSLTHHRRTGAVHVALPGSETPKDGSWVGGSNLVHGFAFEAVEHGHDHHDGHAGHAGHAGHGQCDSPRCHCLTGVLGQTVRPQQPLAVATLNEVAVVEQPRLPVSDRRGRGSGLQGAYVAAGLRWHQVCQRFLN